MSATTLSRTALHPRTARHTARPSRLPGAVRALYHDDRQSQLLEQAARYFPGGSNGNSIYQDVVISRGKGSRVYDSNGREYAPPTQKVAVLCSDIFHSSDAPSTLILP